jgi:hypothetical protein
MQFVFWDEKGLLADKMAIGVDKKEGAACGGVEWCGVAVLGAGGGGYFSSFLISSSLRSASTGVNRLISVFSNSCRMR